MSTAPSFGRKEPAASWPDEHGTFVREEGTCGFLALVVSEGVVVGEAEHFVYDDRSAHASLSPSTTR